MQVRGLVSINFAYEVVFDLMRIYDSILRTDRIVLTGKDRNAQRKIFPSATLSKRNSTWINLKPNLDLRDEDVNRKLKVGPYQFICPPPPQKKKPLFGINDIIKCVLTIS
jgi:hypothetical protein